MAIHILSDSLASRIAAGEVIERPASVVKELAENSLDAGARRIDISIEAGGLGLVRVVDDGSGIPPGELHLAFERFATSKIGEDSDLDDIQSMGFRGEALPSIASVAELDAVSRLHGSDEAARCSITFGEAGETVPAGAPPGTSITVRNLFRNVPARLKFTSSQRGETTRIQDVVTSLALSRPGVAFSLSSDGKNRIKTPGGDNLVDTVAALYGGDLAASMLGVDSGDGSPFRVAGLIAPPSQSRGNRRHISLSVNGRHVENRRIAIAVEQACHGYLPERRFPMAVLHIIAPYEDVDVNVHPAKAEVRFLREQLVFGLVLETVREALSKLAPVHRVALGSRRETGGGRFDGTAAERELALRATWPSQALGDGGPAEVANGGNNGGSVPGPEHEPVTGSEGSEAVLTHRQALPVLRVIGQSQDTYIVTEGPDGLYLIDQHAAHERVLYERVTRQFADRASESQPLLEPEAIELSPVHHAELTAHLDELSATGFQVEHFGERSILLRAVPSVLAGGGGSGRGALIGLLDGIADGRRSGWWAERMLATIACHSAIRAGRTVAIEEAKALIRQLEDCEQPRTCPHGRPTMVHLASGQLEREFGRR